MKKYIYLFFISTFIIGCSEKKEVLEIPLTSNSQEAVSLFQNEVFRPKRAYRLFSQEMGKVLSQILEKDPNFHLSSALLGAYSWNMNSDTRREIIIKAYENINAVSEIEKAIITSIYEDYISGNLVKAEQILEDIVKKYPDYYYLWLYLGSFQNAVVLNPKKAQLSWEKALEIDQDNSLAKLLLAQLHFVTTVDFQILPEDEINLDKAISLIQQVEKKEPENVTCPRLLGNIYRARGEFDLSLKTYERAMSLLENKESNAYGQLLLVSGHNYLFKEDYDKTRELYRQAISKDYSIGSDVNISRWLANTYLYEKKYNEAIKEVDALEERIKNFSDLDDVRRNFLLFQCDFERFLTYGHSQMKEDAFKSLQKMNDHSEVSKNLRKQFASSDSEIERIELEVEINKGFMNIWYLILFGEYEDASEKLKSYSQLSSSFLVYDSKAMINFYKLSGYLNLMSGNVDASLSFYDQIPRELLDGDNYHLYFYALATKARGNIEKSNELFEYLANYNFAGWQNSIIRSLAQSQLKT